MITQQESERQHINYRTNYFSTSTTTKAIKIPFLHNLNNKVFVDTYVDTRLMDIEQDKTEYLTTIQDIDEPRKHQTEITTMENSEIIKAIPAVRPNTFRLYKELINQSRTKKHKRNNSEKIIKKEI